MSPSNRRLTSLHTATVIILLLILTPTSTISTPLRATVKLARNESTDERRAPLHRFVSEWWVVFTTVITALPWAIVAVWDAIDRTYRTRIDVARRLALSTSCLLLAYISGLIFVFALIQLTLSGVEQGRYDEVATVLVLLVFNLWHVGRNIRGWSQFFALRKLRPIFLTIQTNYARTFPLEREGTIIQLDSQIPGLAPGPFGNTEGQRKPCIQGLDRLMISDRLIDNDWTRETPYLSPFYAIRAARHVQHPGREEEAWAVAMWRAWWTQDAMFFGQPPHGFEAPKYFRCDRKSRHVRVANLLSSDPVFPKKRAVIDDATGREITNKQQWAECLVNYGWDSERDGGIQGQQDTHCAQLPALVNVYNARGIAVMVHEKTHRQPNRMCALWYNTARFEDVYDEVRDYVRVHTEYKDIMLPSWGSWLRIAQDIGTHLQRPVFLSDPHLVNFAGELASASLILVRFPDKFKELVDQVHQDGLNARWTFGWSGLLACFSQLWTKERIYIAMMNGLSLLALNAEENVTDLDENVRSMLYGYAAFEVSDRAVGKRIAEDRKAELLRRYTLNKGKTCRGSGVCATRLACMALGIPGEASHMDGLPAFCTGWASEYLERQPGNQTPEHGATHDAIEDVHGSSNVYRYPHSHT